MHILNHRTHLSSRGLTAIYRQTLKRKNQGKIYHHWVKGHWSRLKMSDGEPQDEEVTPKTPLEDEPENKSPPEDVKKHWICCKCEHENSPELVGDPPKCVDCSHEKCEDDCKMVE